MPHDVTLALARLTGGMSDDLRERARAALAGGEPLRLAIRALTPRIPGRPVRFTAEAVRSMAASAANQPIMPRVHDGGWGAPPPEEGVVRSASADGLTLDAVVEYSMPLGEQALEAFRIGIEPGWSIHAGVTSETLFSCSCGESYRDERAYYDHIYDDGHFPGRRDKGGKPYELIFGGRMELVEITRTHVPAAEGTGVLGVALTDVPFMARLAAEQERRAMETEETTSALADLLAQAQAEAAEARREATEARRLATEAQASADREREARTKAERLALVRAYRRSGHLSGTDAELLERTSALSDDQLAALMASVTPSEPRPSEPSTLGPDAGGPSATLAAPRTNAELVRAVAFRAATGEDAEHARRELVNHAWRRN
jgi:hypothetical protein